MSSDRFSELDGAILTGLAPAARAYHQALIAQGFTPQEAMTLVVAWQTSWLEAEAREPPGSGGSPPT